ncbi:MAG: hypothetical protein VXY65_03230 [Actinomycetota bacterium]|nr:hypothetical protein [Actinomycetota bacterium]MED5328937.1 hypothetical protein [Actinomycetota bacterium]MED5570765.1 hypothetical protein [Actinomycetota bacterium]
MKKSGRRQQRTLVAIALLSCWTSQSCDTNDGREMKPPQASSAATPGLIPH